MTEAVIPPSVETAISHWLKLVGLGIEILAAMVIVIGVTWSTYLFLRRQMAEEHYNTYKIRIGRSLLLGLEVVVAADIVKTIAVEASLMSLAVLAGLVLIRTFLSWTLVLEIEGRWPWQRIGTISMRPTIIGQSPAHPPIRPYERAGDAD